MCPITLGCMSLGENWPWLWNEGRMIASKEEGIACVRRAFELGVHRCDTAQGYGAGLRAEKLDASTRIYVTADHGFDDNSSNHGNAPHVFLATNDPAVTRGGLLPDVPATVLARLGLNVTVLQPPLAGQVLTGAVATVEAPAC